MKRAISAFILGLTLVMASFTSYASQDPEALLSCVTEELISTLRSKSHEIKSNPTAVYRIVDKILVPHVDWQTMSKWVLGRSVWMQANEQQRNAFAKEFKDLLVRTYASTLKTYNNQVIEYLPLRGGVGDKQRVQIDSLIKEPNKSPIRVTYRMVKVGGKWKVYDMVIEGISLLQGFRSQFATELQQSSIDQLIRRLHQHNEKPII